MVENMNINDKIQEFLNDDNVPGPQKALLKTFISVNSGQEMTVDFIQASLDKLQQSLGTMNRNTKTGVETYILTRILSTIISE